jgi:hypothetical protein
VYVLLYRSRQTQGKANKIMINYKIWIKGNSGTLSVNVYKTKKGALSAAKRIANEAFYGEEVQITLEEIN